MCYFAVGFFVALSCRARVGAMPLSDWCFTICVWPASLGAAVIVALDDFAAWTKRTKL